MLVSRPEHAAPDAVVAFAPRCVVAAVSGNRAFRADRQTGSLRLAAFWKEEARTHAATGRVIHPRLWPQIEPENVGKAFAHAFPEAPKETPTPKAAAGKA